MHDEWIDAVLTLALVASLLMCVWVTDAFWQIPGTVSTATLAGVLRAVGVVVG